MGNRYNFDSWANRYTACNSKKYLLKVPRIIISSTQDRYLQFHIAILTNILLFTAFFYFSFIPNIFLLFALYTLTQLPQNLFLQLLTGIL